MTWLIVLLRRFHHAGIYFILFIIITRTMKTLRYLTLAALVASVTACTGDENLNQTPVDENRLGGVYLNLAVALDEDADALGRGSYDGATGDYEQGTVDESTIKNGAVYLFQGNDETDAKYVAKGTLAAWSPDNLEADGSQFTVKNLSLKNVELTQFNYMPEHTYMALIVLNANDGFIAPAAGQSFTQWAKTPQTNNMQLVDGDKTYITMSNATGHANHVASSPFTPSTLVKVAAADISTSPFDDSQLSSTTIYVQRNVAKVTLRRRDGIQGYDRQVQTGEFTVQVDMANWYLNGVNTATYPVMNIDGLTWDKNYFHSGFEQFDRVFWAKDPNYDGTPEVPMTAESSVRTDVQKSLYALENTFDHERMVQSQTTRVMLVTTWKVEATDVGNIVPEGYNFTWSFQNDQGGTTTQKGFYVAGDKNLILDRGHIESAIKAKASEVLSTAEDNVSVDWKRLFAGGYYSLQQLLAINVDGQAVTDNAKLDVIAGALSLKDWSTDPVSLYFNYNMYYPIYLRHFDEVAWDENAEVKKRDDGVMIADYNAGHLGRYGLVRNNSYTVTVNSIHSLGLPTAVPASDVDTDDMPTSGAINVSITVEPWAKRTVIADMN